MKLTIKTNDEVVNVVYNCLGSFINFLWNRERDNEFYHTTIKVKENLEYFEISFLYYLVNHDGSKTKQEYIYEMPRESGGFINTHKIFNENYQYIGKEDY